MAWITFIFYRICIILLILKLIILKDRCWYGLKVGGGEGAKLGLKVQIIFKFWPAASAAHGVLRLIVEMKGEKSSTVIHIWIIAPRDEKLIETKNIIQDYLDVTVFMNVHNAHSMSGSASLTPSSPPSSIASGLRFAASEETPCLVSDLPWETVRQPASAVARIRAGLKPVQDIECALMACSTNKV